MDSAIIGRASGKRMYHSLDGLRGVAAVLVVFYHFNNYLAPLVVGSAYLAVDLFFLMSGFVIANAYQDRLGYSLGAVRFTILRFIRLYPLYLAGTVIGLIVVVAPLARPGHPPGDWGAIAGMAVPALLMLPWPYFATHTLLYPLNFPAWSLFCELVANAIYGSSAKLRRGWRLPATMACAGAGLIVVASRFGSLDGGWLWPHWWVGLVRVFFSFSLGVVVYRMHAAGRLPTVKFPVLPLYVVVGAVLCMSPGAQFRTLYDLAAVFVVFPVVVWLCVVNEPHRGLRLYTLAGLMSYPIYTVHEPIIMFVKLFGYHQYGYDGFNARLAAWAPWSGLAMLAVVMPLSWLLAVTYDVWARRLLNRVADRAGRASDIVPEIRQPAPRPETR